MGLPVGGAVLPVPLSLGFLPLEVTPAQKPGDGFPS